jgi:hypothetical protein
MSRRPLRELARRFERRCLRPLLGRGPRQREGDHEAFIRIESRLELLERLLRESLGLQYVALRETADPHPSADDR